VGAGEASCEAARQGVVFVAGAHFEPEFPPNEALMFEREITLSFATGTSGATVVERRVDDVVIGERELLAAVDVRAGLVGEVMRFVHAHPELGHEEHECSRHLAAVLAGLGSRSRRPSAGWRRRFARSCVVAVPAGESVWCALRCCTGRAR